MVDASKGMAEILTANQEMASGVNGQTAQIEQIATAIEELSNSSLEAANNCVDASDSTTAALQLAESGGEVMQSTFTQMISIKDAIEGAINSMCKEATQAVSMIEKGGVKVDQGGG